MEIFLSLSEDVWNKNLIAAKCYWLGGGGTGNQTKEKALKSSMPEMVESKAEGRSYLLWKLANSRVWCLLKKNNNKKPTF